MVPDTRRWIVPPSPQGPTTPICLRSEEDGVGGGKKEKVEAKSERQVLKESVPLDKQCLHRISRLNLID